MKIKVNVTKVTPRNDMDFYGKSLEGVFRRKSSPNVIPIVEKDIKPITLPRLPYENT